MIGNTVVMPPSPVEFEVIVPDTMPESWEPFYLCLYGRRGLMRRGILGKEMLEGLAELPGRGVATFHDFHGQMSAWWVEQSGVQITATHVPPERARRMLRCRRLRLTVNLRNAPPVC